MDAVKVIQGAVANLRRANVDTDVIIRIERLANAERSQLGQFAFESLRFAADGSADPSFPYNQEAFTHAPILTAGRNFGCGSSREGAVWALVSLGVRCVIAPSFGEIFHNNCFQNGLLPIALAEPLVDQIAAATDSGAELVVDLEQRKLLLPDGNLIPFSIDARRREALLEGRDEISQTLTDHQTIRAWQEQDKLARPWVWKAKTS
ncbi:MAG: 3-isopropylmalate dehydratase small subunit [Burkholderiaceae bacterium]